MMTHLHVKSTEPKTAPQPVSTEQHPGGTWHYFFPASLPPGRRIPSLAALNIERLKFHLVLVTFYEQCSVLGIQGDTYRVIQAQSSATRPHNQLFFGTDDWCYTNMLKHIMTALWKEKMKNRTKSNLSDFSLVETQREDCQTRKAEEENVCWHGLVRRQWVWEKGWGMVQSSLRGKREEMLK